MILHLLPLRHYTRETLCTLDWQRTHAQGAISHLLRSNETNAMRQLVSLDVSDELAEHVRVVGDLGEGRVSRHQKAHLIEFAVNVAGARPERSGRFCDQDQIPGFYRSFSGNPGKIGS